MLRKIMAAAFISFLSVSVILGAKPETKMSRSYDESKCMLVVDSVKKAYAKQQYLYNKDHASSQYIFQIIPITLYPFFCVDVEPSKKYETIYLDGYRYSAFRYVDQLNNEHLQLGVLFYMKGLGYPPFKTYRLHYFFFNMASNQWEQEEPPREIILELTDPKQGIYGCRTTKKKGS